MSYNNHLTNIAHYLLCEKNILCTYKPQELCVSFENDLSLQVDWVRHGAADKMPVLQFDPVSF